MLELRPTCENCNCALPPESLARTEIKYRPVDAAQHLDFVKRVGRVPPEKR